MSYIFTFIYHKIQITIKQDSNTETNEIGEEAQKRYHGAYRLWVPSELKIKLINSHSKARIESKIQ